MMADDDPQIIELLEQKAKCINTIDDKWISEWATLIEKYFKHDTRNHIRLKAIASLSQIFSKYYVICGDELMSKIILPNFNDADQETDPVVRKPIVHLLFDVASICLSYKHCNAILAIIRRILTKPFKQLTAEDPTSSGQATYVIGNVDIIDSRLIVSNLAKLFKSKLQRLPIDPAVNMLDITVNYLNLTYRHPVQDPVPAEIPMIRRELFSFFLNIRCNKHGHLGVLSQNQDLNEITYSPFIICVKRPRTSETNQPPPSSPKPPESPTQASFPFPSLNNQHHIHSTTTTNNTNNQPPPFVSHHLHHITSQQQPNIFIPNAQHPNCPIESRCVNLDSIFAGIIECINQETDSDVLKLVLDGLPGLLANKPFVLTAMDERINQLCLALRGLVFTNKNPNKHPKVDLVKCGLRCLTSLLIYRKLLDHRSIKAMLSVFEDSMKISRPCAVPLMTTCLIELQDSSEMARFVPVVLDRFSRYSTTVNLSISMLEFLSYLILFPKLYENFSEDEYKFIFAIALPYTNPTRFSDYITCLAFRVIAMWYLNCRPSLRCAFVEFIRRSLQDNVMTRCQEELQKQQLYSQTSSPITAATPPPITYSLGGREQHNNMMMMSPVDQRKRSASLNTDHNLRKQATALGFESPLALKVNEELMETFADLLSRYTHGQYLAVAPKNRCTEMLIDRATSRTWLHGNSLVTITAGKSNNGWAEIMVRRPTGNTSWIGRLQNTVGALPMFNQQVYTSSLNFGNDIISLFSTMSVTSDDGDNENIDPAAVISSSVSSLLTTSTSGVSSSSSNMASNVSSSNMTGQGGGGGGGGNSGGGGGATMHMQGSSMQHQHHHQQQQPSANQCSAGVSPRFRLQQPMLLPRDKKLDIALANFDRITPYETHKVGVIYVGKNQANDRAAILSNRHGSPRYYEFLSHIGTCIILNDIDPEIYFIGGLDSRGDDGKYAYFWKDNVTQVIFHVATFMLTRDNDPQCARKTRHIGNDHVCIAYNDSRAPFRLSTIKGSGQVIQACIVITPLDEDTNMVEVEVEPKLREILDDIEPRVLSNTGASLYARQLAIHLNLASKIYERRYCLTDDGQCKAPYVSNWVERLRCIKRFRNRLDENRKAANSNSISSRGGSNTMK